MGIDEASKVRPTSDDGIGASFLLGHAGVFGLASVIYHELGTCPPLKSLPIDMHGHRS